MKRIFALKDEIDALDHTLAANPTLGLSKWAFGSNCAWASTEHSANYAWYVHSGGNCTISGGSTKSSHAFGVIPVREM